MLEIIDHGHRHLGHAGPCDAVVARHPDDVLHVVLVTQPVGGAKREANVPVDLRQLVGQLFGQALERAEEAEVDAAFRHPGEGVVQRLFVFGMEWPDMNLGPVVEFEVLVLNRLRPRHR